tara:strand:- start:123 stop:440 length:318 start_codon:yes stop_codon:yes gene_type:complete
MSKESKKKKKSTTKKDKKEIKVAIPVFKRGSNPERDQFMIEKLMEEQPNLTEDEARDLYYLKIRFGESYGDTQKSYKGGIVKKRPKKTKMNKGGMIDYRSKGMFK